MVSSEENSREGVGAAGHGLAAAVAVPDAPGLTADGVAAAEGAAIPLVFAVAGPGSPIPPPRLDVPSVPGVLGDF